MGLHSKSTRGERFRCASTITRFYKWGGRRTSGTDEGRISAQQGGLIFEGCRVSGRERAYFGFQSRMHELERGQSAVHTRNNLVQYEAVHIRRWVCGRRCAGARTILRARLQLTCSHKRLVESSPLVAERGVEFLEGRTKTAGAGLGKMYGYETRQKKPEGPNKTTGRCTIGQRGGLYLGSARAQPQSVPSV
jgi:hypothetical protein